MPDYRTAMRARQPSQWHRLQSVGVDRMPGPPALAAISYEPKMGNPAKIEWKSTD